MAVLDLDRHVGRGDLDVGAVVGKRADKRLHVVCGKRRLDLGLDLLDGHGRGLGRLLLLGGGAAGNDQRAQQDDHEATHQRGDCPGGKRQRRRGPCHGGTSVIGGLGDVEAIDLGLRAVSADGGGNDGRDEVLVRKEELPGGPKVAHCGNLLRDLDLSGCIKVVVGQV